MNIVTGNDTVIRLRSLRNGTGRFRNRTRLYYLTTILVVLRLDRFFL